MVDYSKYKFIKVEKKERVAILTLNNPDAMNAIGKPEHHEIESIFEDMNEDPEVLAVILTGAGRAFSAGGDINLMVQGYTDHSIRISSTSVKRIVLNHLSMKIFMSGIITGSLTGKDVHDQSYRTELRRILQEAMPEALVRCPWDMHPDAVEYGPERAREALVAEVDEAAGSDLVVAYIPQASMGTAIEMWEAFNAGARIVTISPLAENWVVKFLSNRVVTTLDEFEQLVESGEFEKSIVARQGV